MKIPAEFAAEYKQSRKVTLVKRCPVLYHRTSAEVAAKILTTGFRDGTGKYMTDREFTGVWLANRPIDANEGADGDTILSVTFHIGRSQLRQYEWVEDGKGYREWLIPAEVIHRLADVRLFEETYE